MKFLLLASVACFLTALPVASQTPPSGGFSGSAPIDYETAHLNKIVTAFRITEPITLDGRLDEPAWRLALPATDFIQSQPFAGQPSHERTEVRFLYDDNNLYIGVICFDSEARKMVVNDLREDFNFNGTDGISIIIDSLHDRRSGFQFGTNPAGARRDSQISNDGTFGDDWDGAWDVKVTRNDEGYIAEFQIPFTTLRFSKSASQEWGVNMNRRTLRVNENSSWSPIPVRYSVSRMSLAGTLQGLENIHQGRNLKIKPFVTAGVTETRNRSPERKNKVDGGLDLKYGLTPSLTLDATYRTDFAQVEVDQQQVNLTRFNLFFPEKRDFFLENAGTFNFGATGSGNFGGGGGNSGNNFSGGGSTGDNLIPFFSRHIGRSDDGTPIPITGGGRMTGQLGRYDVGVLAMKTERLGSTPANNFVIGRLKRNLMKNSWVGALLTNRDSAAPGDYNRVYGPDARFQFFNKLDFESYLLKSDTGGLVGNNQARKFRTAWRDDELNMSAGYYSVQSNFRPDVGFLRRPNVTQYTGTLGYDPLLRNSATIRNLRFETTMDYYAGASSRTVETRTQTATTGIQFQNQASISFIVNQTFDRLTRDDRVLGVSIPRGDYKYRSYSANANTDRRRRIGGNGRVTWGDFWDGTRTSFDSTVTLRPTYRWNIDVIYSRNRVALMKGRGSTDLFGTRLVYGFSPHAFFNAFVQYNAATQRISSNIRFNWIHHPLSDLYVVYNDTRDTATGQRVERALIVKFTNLFNF